MATSTLGTNATNSLTAIVMSGAMNTTDLAAVVSLILDDQLGSDTFYPGAFAQNGLLYVPNRGVLRVLPGDFVGVDSEGWPILVSKNSAADGNWTHVP